jgi:arabinogalactan oligomer/maltooligosaccharide transport system permease protein
MALGLLNGCGDKEWDGSLTIWHQMTPQEREILRQVVAEYTGEHPGLEVDLLYKETEELRSAYQAAAIAGAGPELIFGPADQVGPFASMKVIQPLDSFLDSTALAAFDPKGVVRYDSGDGGRIYQLAPMVGNHLALVINRDLVRDAPRTMEALIRTAKALTVDDNGDGRPERYGLVWNYSEPYFFIPFFGGYGGRVMDDDARPTLAVDAMQRALELVLRLRDEARIIPQECDYNIADTMFKEGRAAMIINGPWSWSGYQEAGVPITIARIPRIDATGLWPTPMVSPKGYSLNANVAPGERRDAALELLRYLTGPRVQERFTRALGVIPTSREVASAVWVEQDPTLRASMAQAAVGVPMPVVPEMRAIWDAMRPIVQGVMGGSITVDDAGSAMQRAAEQGIREMREGEGEGGSKSAVGAVLLLTALALCAALYLTATRFVRPLLRMQAGRERETTRFALWMIAPASLALLAVVAYPFAYNVLISLSNMSMTSIRSWEIVGFLQYKKVFVDPMFYRVLLRTVVWTLGNVTLHVVLGVFLALVIQQDLFGKRFYKGLLILPWAVPQYITALTWRGEFNAEYGAVNLLLGHLGIAPVAWLSGEGTTFAACLIANVWLGFPFMMMIALGALQSIPRDLYEAARIDGAGPWERLVHVTIPLLKPVMVPAITLGIVWTFNNLNVVWLISNGGEPSNQTHILVTYVYKAAFNLYRYGYAAALSMVIFAILATFSVSFLNRSRADEGSAR